MIKISSEETKNGVVKVVNFDTFQARAFQNAFDFVFLHIAFDVSSSLVTLVCKASPIVLDLISAASSISHAFSYICLKYKDKFSSLHL